MKRFIYRLLIPIIFLNYVSFTQFRESKSEIFRGEQNLFIEAVAFPTLDSTARVDILYRVSKDFFIFVKNAEEKYSANGDIVIEILDNLKKSVARKITPISISKSIQQKNNIDDQLGIVSFTVPYGEYQVFIEVNDSESARRISNDKLKINLNDKISPSLRTSDLFFIKTLDPINSEVIVPIYLDGNVPLGGEYCAYLELILKDIKIDTSKLSFNILNIDDKKMVIENSKSFHIINSKSIFPSTLANYENQTKNIYKLKKSENSMGIIINLPDKNLKMGNYELKLNIYKGDLPKEIKKNFKVEWVNMPRTLRDIDIAIDMLEYIATKEEMKEISAWNKEKRKENFLKFWEKHDPTPGTAFNELMAEYYQRADIANIRFSSIKNEQGAKTDRGKIFILYGEPSNIERTLLPDSPALETWTYSRLSKKILFEDKNRNGDFKLKEIKDL